MRPTLSNLQALRGVACLAVVLYHVAGWEVMIWSPVKVLWPVRWFGFAGVDLFFALSGFIITWAHHRDLGRPWKLPGYLFRRAWRIYPPYWAALPVAIALSATVAKQPVFTPGWPSDWLDWVLLAPRSDACRFVPVAWSLFYELMFYLGFALLFLIPRRAAAVFACLWAVLVVAAKVFDWRPGAFAAELAVSPLVLEFVGGALAAGLMSRGVTRGARPCIALAVTWLVALGALFHTKNPDELGGNLWPRVLTFGPPAVLAVYAAAAGDESGTLRLPRWLRPIGDASYSIYLLHVPGGVTALFLTWRIGHSLLPHLVWIGAMIAAGVGGGWVMYRLVERPLMKLGKRRKPPAEEPKPVVVMQRVEHPQHSRLSPESSCKSR
jgi:peptidoglycan/LPS O-acetylase OafA/YrhL